MEPTDRPEYDHTMGAARTLLGEVGFAAAWESGRGLSINAAITEALNV